MARNEEKQQGKLNRLWLQKERDEGRLKDKRETRPKLCTLNTAASVKKWIPSIKNEIEYYLQQSQLTHYPERKIAEFQLKIEALEKEYKNVITKLRVLDPSCKHHPWTPRAYCKRRTDQSDSQLSVKKPYSTLTERVEESDGHSNGRAGTFSTNLKAQITNTFQTESRTTNQVCCNLDINNADQNLPLSFDQSRLAVAVASYRGSSGALGLTQANHLTRVLQTGLPNLGSSVMKSSPQQNNADKDQKQIAESTWSDDCKFPVQERPQCAPKNVLGLNYYSSSDDEGEST